MKLKFIGTGSGLTSLKRYHSSILLTTDSQNLLVDAGDGIDRALLSAGESFNAIDSIIISHYHPDHFSGVASLLVQMKILNRTNPLKIYTHSKLIEVLNSYIFSCNLFISMFDFKVDIIGFKEYVQFVIDDSIICMAKQNMHIQNKYNLKIKNPFISNSFLFNTGNKNIIFTADIGDKTDLLLFNDSNPVDYFIVDSTHVELDDIRAAVKKMNPAKVYLTHINDDDEENIVGWIAEQNKINNIYNLAEDGLTLL